MASPEPQDLARTQALCWLLDELFDAEEDLLELVARPGALVGWRRERLGVFCERVVERLGVDRKDTTRQVYGDFSISSNTAYPLPPPPSPSRPLGIEEISNICTYR
jgi:hypothetical protein